MPTRIALVTRPAVGGIRRHLHTLISGLQQAGWEPLLLAPPDFMVEGLSVPQYPMAFSVRQSPPAHIRTVFQLTRWLQMQAPHIVHAHGLWAALLTAPATWRAQLPFVFTLHNLIPRLSAPQRLFFQWAAKRASRIIAVSEAVARTAEAVGIPSQWIEVIPNGIDPTPFLQLPSRKEARAQLSLPLDRPVVASVGRLSQEKGFDVLLVAAQRLANQPVPPLVVIAGDGPERASLAQQASSLKHVRLLGPLPSVEPLYAAADLVVIPSREEGQGIVAIEAMFARKAIVATAVGGLMETLDGGRCGRLVPPGDAVALAEAIGELLADPAGREHAIEAAFRRATALYTADRMVARHLALYQELLPKKIFC
ncbi:glycosyltransferase [Chthonomonas calidirosea]|uniref:Glycosyltransferase n=1 Tax=Chthonomonas calidirosea (strain DSM 23976 / ICMP 18418 / T49) TaxID=1303518 RepID=S0EUH7_CHTCT|nr:glycosyltransferase family 4 protein [Chthonomonas calidirosea]CCW35307.1 Glycosyltransferase [Chthonomonas calidirosea T49]CEK20652.1 glycosyltransferase [Chthonomonas calidirosea]